MGTDRTQMRASAQKLMPHGRCGLAGSSRSSSARCCKGSCGCTVPQCPKEPIAPGAEGEIEVKFNSKGKGGAGGKKNTKTVTVNANTVPEQTRITISANVLPAADAEAGK